MRARFPALALAALAAGSLMACKPKPAPPLPPPKTPLTFTKATPDASVRLAIAPAIATWPSLHEKLYGEGVEELKKDIEAARTDRAHIAGEGFPNPAYEQEITWNLAAYNQRLVSLKGTWMSYTGGAHPNSGFRTLLWDTNSASGPIDRSELLAPPGAGDAAVQAALCDAIHQARIGKGVGPDERPSMWPCPKWRDSDFVLERSGVPGKFGGFTFLFDPYSIGSYAEGPYEVTVHYTVIKNVLAPTYANEFNGGPVHPPHPGELAQDTAGQGVSLDRRDFILRHTRLQRPPHAPELQLHLADEIEPVWRMSEEALGEIGVPPPFWAFAWAGGQALARYLLDNPEEVAGRRVLDVASGSGLVAIAAMKAGATAATANDLDPFCAPAVALNAEANGVAVDFGGSDLLGAPPPEGFDLITAGDVCYEKPFTEKVLAWLELARARGTRVLIGDPGRSYFPATGLERLADYQVETTRELEDAMVKRAGVWTFGQDRSRTNAEHS